MHLRNGLVWLVACAAAAQAPQPTQGGGTVLTVYNGNFAVVRSPLELNLHAGTTDVAATDVTAQVEPDSVVLRDPTGKRAIHILEQNYEGSLRVQAQMLAKFEGKTLDFVMQGANAEPTVVEGKVIRAGAVPQFDLLERYGQNYFYQINQGQPQEEPLIEINGKLRYGLPGTPLFPADAPGLVLKPALRWLIASDKPEHIAAELDYITRGLRWDASYNVIAPGEDAGPSQPLEMIGWVDVTNESGTDFRNASLQLMAGDISKLSNVAGSPGVVLMDRAIGDGSPVQPQVTQKSFDDYHLYDIHRTLSLLDHESKQIEFLNVAKITAHRVYVYDGLRFGGQPGTQYYLQWNQPQLASNEGLNTKVWITQEFANSEENHLGMPLPQGRMRFYRRDAEGNLQFVGENTIDHTPKGESVHVYLGDAFNLTGDRVRTDFKSRQQERTITESFRIILKNAKTVPATVRVVEHMYRTANWEISNNSDPFVKKDAQTANFDVGVPASGEKDVTYTVTYTW